MTMPEPPPARRCQPGASGRRRKADDELSPGAVNDILEFELTDAPILAPARPPQHERTRSPAPAQPPRHQTAMRGR